MSKILKTMTNYSLKSYLQILRYENNKLAGKRFLRAVSKALTEDTFVMKRGRSFHDQGANIQRNRSPSVERDLHDGMFRSLPSFDLR